MAKVGIDFGTSNSSVMNNFSIQLGCERLNVSTGDPYDEKET